MTSAYLVVSAAALAGVTIIAAAMLKGWQGWLDFKSRELDRQPREIERGSTTGANRIELADLKERVRKLEAIAAGVDL